MIGALFGSWMVDLLVVAQVGISLALILAILIQRPRSEGLGTLTGGALEDVVGAQASHVLRRFTGWLGGAFLANSLVLAVLI